MITQPQKINIAIDGPAGAGKSTVARQVANALGYIYVDTGAMYRSVTLKSLQAGLLPEQTLEIVQLARDLQIQLIPGENEQLVYVNGEDVTEDIRSPVVTQHVSKISQIIEIRQFLVKQQKQIAASKGVVMDGRDIGTQVLPDAEVKIFLTAGVQARAERRYKEMREKNQEISLEQLMQEISRRDMMDEQREMSPLLRAKDAVLLDSTELSIRQVVDFILAICRTKVGREK